MSAAARTCADAEEPLDVAPGEELASGMDSSHLENMNVTGLAILLTAGLPIWRRPHSPKIRRLRDRA